MYRVPLKNGAPEDATIVRMKLETLRTLHMRHPEAFSELVSMCRHPSHEATQLSVDVLTRRGAVDSQGGVFSSMRNVVLSAVEGEGNSMSIQSPYCEAD